MNILDHGYARIVNDLVEKTLPQLHDVDITAAKIEDVIGVAQVSMGNGVHLVMKLTVEVITPSNSPSQDEARPS